MISTLLFRNLARIKILNQLRESIHIWYSQVPSVPPNISSLAADEIRKANKFVRPVDQRRHLATRAMVRELLSQYYPLEPAMWRFVTNDFGKPTIDATITADLYFNVSHTSEVIVCAITSFPEIGIDVEDRIPNDLHEVSQHFFAKSEIDWLNESPNDQAARERFTTIWTMKEAYIKAVGKGLSIPLDSFSVAPTRATASAKDQEVNGFRFRRFAAEGATIAVAYPKQFDDYELTMQAYEMP